jgi:hypothetical protein
MSLKETIMARFRVMLLKRVVEELSSATLTLFQKNMDGLTFYLLSNINFFFSHFMLQHCTQSQGMKDLRKT